jgi:hypothetical protein
MSGSRLISYGHTIRLTGCGSQEESRSRDGGNSLLIKEFPGVVFLTGSNSATSPW